MAYRLTPYELELMDVVWQRREATVQDVCDALDRPLAYTTVMTTLNLLESKKRVLAREKRGRAYVYRARISRDDVSQSVLSELRDVLFRDRVGPLVLGLLSDAEVSPEDAKALKLALENIEAQS